MKTIWLLLLLLFLGSTGYSQFVSLSDSEIKELKKLVSENEEVKKMYTSYISIADAAVKTSPNPVETISSAGRLKGDPVKTATTAAIKDFKKMYALALCYRLTGNGNYLSTAATWLRQWATINSPSANPIDNTILDPAIEAFDLVKKYLSSADRLLISNWFKNTAYEEIANIRMLFPAATATNNWNSHRIKTVTEIACAIEDRELKEWAIENFKKQVSKNLKPNGASIDFELRDALHYHVYDLEPLLQTAIVLKRAARIDCYNYVSDKNSSLIKSVHWLLPYLNGQKTHKEYIKTTVKFDIARAKNKEAGHGVGDVFDPARAVKVLLLAAWFEPPLADTAKKIRNSSAYFFDWQCVLNKVRR